MTRILLLGGTTEANLMAKAIADAGLAGVYSYAGRTEAPMGQPIHMRMGGFGGVEGLRTYLVDQAITHVIDATHPFAAQMSTNAVAACTATGTPLIALERAPWVAGEGDRWTHVPDIAAAVAALAGPPQRVFLAIGRQHLDALRGPAPASLPSAVGRYRRPAPCPCHRRRWWWRAAPSTWRATPP